MIAALRRITNRMAESLRHEHSPLLTAYVDSTELPEGWVLKEMRCQCGEVVTSEAVVLQPGMRISGMC